MPVCWKGRQEQHQNTQYPQKQVDDIFQEVAPYLHRLLLLCGWKVYRIGSRVAQFLCGLQIRMVQERIKGATMWKRQTIKTAL